MILSYDWSIQETGDMILTSDWSIPEHDRHPGGVAEHHWAVDTTILGTGAVPAVPGVVDHEVVVVTLVSALHQELVAGQLDGVALGDLNVVAAFLKGLCFNYVIAK